MTDYSRKIGFWEAILTMIPALVLLWALAKYGAGILIWAFLAMPVVFGIKLLYLIYGPRKRR